MLHDVEVQSSNKREQSVRRNNQSEERLDGLEELVAKLSHSKVTSQKLQIKDHRSLRKIANVLTTAGVIITGENAGIVAVSHISLKFASIVSANPADREAMTRGIRRVRSTAD